MYSQSINSFIQDIQHIESDMSLSYLPISSSGFKFSNTGRRGTKYFYVSLSQMVSVLNDIRDQLPKFLPNTQYVEKNWRDLFGENLTDDISNALSTVQTLPFFNLINKIIYKSNELTIPFNDKQMPLSEEYLNIAIEYLTLQMLDEKKQLESLLDKNKLSVGADVVLGENIIYYGAPGTGKSHHLNELTEGDRKIVTVFHPDTQNSDFIGSLKPTNISGAVTYAFRPGPFTTALLEALKNPEQNVYLVIEEINRAPAAAVFGELFQLLDRENGASKYEIDFTDPDMQAYINEQLKAAGLDECSKLSIPANLSLLATMNSSDQAVMPLDTAFKRRWSFRYMKLDFDNPAVSSQNLQIMTTQGVYYITWKDFANKVINHQLKEMKVPEDRLIGPFFLNSTELSNSDTSNEAISGKLFVYLWDDVLRHKGRNIIFDKSIGTFGELHEQFIGGKKSVFSEVIESLIISNSNTADDSTGVAEVDE
ncbi:AAA family ATPase [Proteus columbae]|uniref:McrB family protein n=1 Tax=Proteus columbae TaxID=1987580 RepID=UPI00288C588F|nr:AAA family ATPase [Proteus columbae]